MAAKTYRKTALVTAEQFLPAVELMAIDLVDTIRLGIKDQGYGYTLKGDKLTVSSDEVFAVDIAKLADFIRSALATATEGSGE